MTISGLAESFKTMNRPGLTVTLFDSLFFGKWNFLHNFHSSLQFVLLKFAIDNFNSLETMR